jgi:hypothetical protein
VTASPARRSAALLGPVTGASAAVEPGTEAREHLGHVAHQVVLQLTWAGHYDFPALGRQGCLQVLDAEAGEAVLVLDHQRRRGRVGQ